MAENVPLYSHPVQTIFLETASKVAKDIIDCSKVRNKLNLFYYGRADVVEEIGHREPNFLGMFLC